MFLSSSYPLAGYDFESAAGICSFVFGVLLFAFLDLVVFKLTKKKYWLWTIVLILEICIVVPAAFGMWIMVLASSIALMVFIICYFVIYQLELRGLVDNFNLKLDFSKFLKKRVKTVKPETIFDREEAYSEICKAVIDMSKVKCGALITIMKNDDILDSSKMGSVIKQMGVELNSPIKAELLETIFYEGTRLHDGAVVIKDDKIARASVFFQSTRQALTGKYGARHQAALGISENSDAVTIVVSEETGRIALAIQGEFTPVNPDTLLRTFTEAMTLTIDSQTAENEENK